MGKFVKLFNTDEERTTYENSELFEAPYVSYSKSSDIISLMRGGI